MSGQKMQARPLPAMLRAVTLSLAIGSSMSCSLTEESHTSLANPSPQVIVPEGYSGMARLGANQYLVVHDTKVNKDGPRLGRIDVAKSGYRYSAFHTTDWQDPDGRSNDLEAACSLAQRPGEFLVAESGYRKGKYGRLFHIRVTGNEAQVIRAYKLPLMADNTEESEGDNFEGLACVRQDGDRYLLLLGERGGSTAYKNGWLRWGVFDPHKTLIEWADGGRAGIEVTAPGDWPSGAEPRAISDLYVDPQGKVWSVSTADLGDDGPFRSIVFQIGRVGNDSGQPVKKADSIISAWTIDGMKIEALGPPAEGIQKSALSVASEDENFGGVWRPLFAPSERR